MDRPTNSRNALGLSAESASDRSAVREDEDQAPRFTRFAAQRIGRWRRQQALITAIEVLFVAGAVTAWVLLR